MYLELEFPKKNHRFGLRRSKNPRNWFEPVENWPKWFELISQKCWSTISLDQNDVSFGGLEACRLKRNDVLYGLLKALSFRGKRPIIWCNGAKQHVFLTVFNLGSND